MNGKEGDLEGPGRSSSPVLARQLGRPVSPLTVPTVQMLTVLTSLTGQISDRRMREIVPHLEPKFKVIHLLALVGDT